MFTPGVILPKARGHNTPTPIIATFPLGWPSPNEDLVEWIARNAANRL
jgi:hypothetical protein